MKDRQFGLPMALTLCSLVACPLGALAVGSADLAAAEKGVRAADAAWAAAAQTGNIDAWMAFYSADTIVMPPNASLTSGKDLARQSISTLLAHPHLSMSWHPINVQVAASADLASLTGGYELHFDDARGAPVADHGKVLEIWRRDSDGSWRCIVDTWISDGSTLPATSAASAPNVAPAAVAVGASAAAAAAPVAAAAAPAMSTPGPSRAGPSEYGEMPLHYEDAIRQYFDDHLKDPGSIRYQQITTPEKGHVAVLTGGVLYNEKQLLGWTVKATVDAKNSHGNYVGWVTYSFLFRGEQIVHTTIPH
jgi:ketosteroid isomerase-like protein